MKRMLTALWLPMALSIAIAAGAAPQQSDQNQSGQSSGSWDQSGQSGQSGMEHKVSLTGCLQSGTDPNTYILTNATSSSAKTSKKRSSQAPNEMARAENSYILVPENGIDLSKHVGHRVRVTGSIEEGSGSSSGTTGSMGSTGSSASSSSTGSSSQSSQSSNMTRFDVRSIKHVSNTCQ